MTDAAVPAPVEADPKPKKKAGLIRWWGFLLIFALVIATFVALPIFANSFVRAKITNGLASQGWELTPETDLDVSVFGARVTLTNVHLRAIGQTQDMLTMTRANAHLNVIDSILFGDIIIQELAAEGMQGTLRRGPDGRIPGEPPTADGSSGPPTDWKKYYEQIAERAKKWAEERKLKKQQEGEQKPGDKPAPPPVQESEPDFEWPKATRYKPTPHADRRVPRVVIRVLKVSGTGFALPDDTPFDVKTFMIDGTNICARQDLNETMTLTGNAATAGAGQATFDFTRRGDETGALKLNVPAVPLASLRHPALAGEDIAKYGATGTASVEYASTWKDDDHLGHLSAMITGLALAPTAAAGGDVQKAAQIVNALKGKPVTWPMVLGGKIYAPTITDYGVDDLMKNALSVDAVKEAAREAAMDKATEELNKRAEKDPNVKKGVDAFKGLLGK